MENFFYNFKTRKEIRSTLLIIYAFTAWFYWIVYSCSTEYNELGYFLLSQRGHISKFEGQGAITTILFSKYITSLFLIISTYYTISAIVSIRKKTMYVPGTNIEYINCPSCNESVIIRDNFDFICHKCKVKAADFVLKYSIKEEGLRERIGVSKRIFKADQLKTLFLISLTVAVKASLIIVLFKN